MIKLTKLDPEREFYLNETKIVGLEMEEGISIIFIDGKERICVKEIPEEIVLKIRTAEKE